MRDFLVWHGGAVFVCAVHEIPDHILASFQIWILATGADDIHVHGCHSLMCVIPPAIAREGKTREEEVDGCESHIEVVVHLREGVVESFAHFLSLQTAGCGEDDDFTHGVGDVDYSSCTLERGRVGNVILHLLLDQGDI